MDSSYDMTFEAINPTFKGPMLESLAEEGSINPTFKGPMLESLAEEGSINPTFKGPMLESLAEEGSINPTFKGPMLESLAEEESMVELERGSVANSEENAPSVVTRSQVYLEMENGANTEQAARKTSEASISTIKDFGVPGLITNTGIIIIIYYLYTGLPDSANRCSDAGPVKHTMR